MRSRGRTVALSTLAPLFLVSAVLLFTQGFHVASGHVPVENLVVEPELVVGNVHWPVSLAFAPDGTLYFNERFTGNVRVVEDGNLSDRVVAHEDVHVDVDTGLIGLAHHPDLDGSAWLYLYYNDLDDGGDMRGTVVRYRLDADGNATDREVVLADLPAHPMHSAGIVEFGPDGKLYVSVGDASSEHRVYVPWTLNGKILRYTPEGDIPADNPWPRSPALSLGHRNAFGMAWDARTDRLYVTENGPDHSDEVNLIVPGANYGWPLTMGMSRLPFQQPEIAYDQVIAPTEMDWYDGDKLGGNLTDALYFGDWVGQSLHRLDVDGTTGHITRDEIVLRGHSFLDVEAGPDGYLYFSTPGEIFRVVLKSGA